MNPYMVSLSQNMLEGAQFLAIITNDAWWGNTVGHKQLLSYARLRPLKLKSIVKCQYRYFRSHQFQRRDY